MIARFLLNKRVRRVFQLTAIALCFLLCIFYIILYANDFQSINLERHYEANRIPETARARRLKEMLQCTRQTLVGATIQYNDYWLLRNYIRGSLSAYMDCADSLTYTTSTDYGFLSNLPALVSRWLAPISLALYAPGDDFSMSMNSIQFLRNCLPESDLIRQFVTFHIYFPVNHMPVHVPYTEERALRWPYNCTVLLPPYENVNRSALYKAKAKLEFPINTGRNMARMAANTYFVLQADMDLTPSVGLAEQFLDMVAQNESVIRGGTRPRVFPLPVFEVHENVSVPTTKQELLKMLAVHSAIPFQRNTCAQCHKVPKYSEWLNATSPQLHVFTVARRERKFKRWEPYFISDNKDPLYDTRFIWEGMSDKRVQGYAMCLLGYEYHVLHPGFLVHRLGIKYEYTNGDSAQKIFKKYTYDLIKKKIIPEYRLLYGTMKQCTI